VASSASEPTSQSAAGTVVGTPEGAAPPHRPLVGLTTYMQQASWAVWDTEAVILPAEYVTMVVAAGAVPVLLPPHGTGTSVLDSLDGLVLTGGADVGPDRYGAQSHPRTRAQPWRDEHEFTLFAAARDRGLPVLGICRGLQVVNAARGGTLHQHVPEVLGTDRYQPAPGEYGQMIARTEPDSLIAAIVGDTVTAPCYHHQSVDRVGEGLTVTARTDDGVVEVLEGAPDEPWLLAVQWHPEHNPVDVRVVAAFVEAARTHAGRAGASEDRASDPAAEDSAAARSHPPRAHPREDTRA